MGVLAPPQNVLEGGWEGGGWGGRGWMGRGEAPPRGPLRDSARGPAQVCPSPPAVLSAPPPSPQGRGVGPASCFRCRGYKSRFRPAARPAAGPGRVCGAPRPAP